MIAAYGCQTGDPNWDADHPYRDALWQLAGTGAVVVDLHGMRDSWGVSVCVGAGASARGRGRHACAEVTQAALAHELRVGAGYPFAARGRTITSWVQHQGGAAVQLELARLLRDPAWSASAETVSFLVSVVRRLEAIAG